MEKCGQTYERLLNSHFTVSKALPNVYNAYIIETYFICVETFIFFFVLVPILSMLTNLH